MTIEGIEKAKSDVEEISKRAVSALQSLDRKNDFLEELVLMLVNRKNKERLTMVLEKINHPNDIKNLKKEELPLLADEIREFLIRTISESGGHLASNLGVVELTMAMHLVFDLPKDKMIWDVGHQAYTHKLLTGRRENFANLRKFGDERFPETL